MALQFITPIANLAGTWLKGRQKKAEVKQKLAVAKIEAQVKNGILKIKFPKIENKLNKKRTIKIN